MPISSIGCLHCGAAKSHYGRVSRRRKTQIPPLGPFRSNPTKAVSNSSITRLFISCYVSLFFFLSNSFPLLSFYMYIAGGPWHNAARAICGIEAPFRSMTRPLSFILANMLLYIAISEELVCSAENPMLPLLISEVLIASWSRGLTWSRPIHIAEL